MSTDSAEQKDGAITEEMVERACTEYHTDKWRWDAWAYYKRDQAKWCDDERTRMRRALDAALSAEQSKDNTLLRLWPIERIEKLEEIAAKPDAGQNKILVLELLDALKRSLHGGGTEHR